MKTKLHDRLRKLLSKHFVKSLFNKYAVPIKANRQSILAYWHSCPQQLKHTSLCFFSKELIELVNNTNTKLLYADFLMKPGKSTETDYNLLNAFELLWNVTDGSAD